MVRKIGDKPTRSIGTTPIQSTKIVGTSKVGSVDQVQAATRQERAGAVRGGTREMTPAEREYLFRVVHEEADKLFGPDGLPEKKRETVEGAVKMALDAAILDAKEDEGD